MLISLKTTIFLLMIVSHINLLLGQSEMIKVKIKRKNYFENKEGFIAGFVAKQNSTYAIVAVNRVFLEFRLDELEIIEQNN